MFVGDWNLSLFDTCLETHDPPQISAYRAISHGGLTKPVLPLLCQLGELNSYHI